MIDIQINKQVNKQIDLYVKPYVKINSKSIIDLDVIVKIINLLEQNIENQYFHKNIVHLRLDNKFLGKTTKAGHGRQC